MTADHDHKDCTRTFRKAADNERPQGREIIMVCLHIDGDAGATYCMLDRPFDLFAPDAVIIVRFYVCCGACSAQPEMSHHDTRLIRLPG